MHNYYHILESNFDFIYIITSEFHATSYVFMMFISVLLLH